jgi:hypothetical protein
LKSQMETLNKELEQNVRISSIVSIIWLFIMIGKST